MGKNIRCDYLTPTLCNRVVDLSRSTKGPTLKERNKIQLQSYVLDTKGI